MTDTRPPTSDDQEIVAAILRAAPPAGVPADFVARVNARIDETSGWLALADFRLWTLRLAPAAAALALVAVWWPGTPAAKSPPTAASSAAAATQTFSPASSIDWQQDVSVDALLDAALRPTRGSGGR